jgi:protein arginine kinase
MNLDDLTGRFGEWLKGTGPDSDIVVSSRIRLARNLGNFPFIRRCTDIDRANIESTVQNQVLALTEFSDALYVPVEELDELDRQFLVERQLISRELSESDGARSVIINPAEHFSVMINEEDHLRLQVMKSGCDMEAAWEIANALDDALESHLDFAFHDRWGYLTACPTNVGTGLRVSVMLHLPALVQTRQIDRVFRSLQKINLAVRGLFGEGSQAMGDFYQISNQLTLGKTEEELIEQVGEVVPVLIDYERKARDFLLTSNRLQLQEQVDQAYETLRKAQQISSEETMHLLSKLRMGVNLELIDAVDIPLVNRLFLETQPAHLQKLKGSPLGTTDRNLERGLYLQSTLGSIDQGKPGPTS